jgi:hypothetical protein
LPTLDGRYPPLRLARLGAYVAIALSLLHKRDIPLRNLPENASAKTPAINVFFNS